MYLSSVAEILSSHSLHTIIAFSEAWKELSEIILPFEVVVKKTFKLFSIYSYTHPSKGQFQSELSRLWWFSFLSHHHTIIGFKLNWLGLVAMKSFSVFCDFFFKVIIKQMYLIQWLWMTKSSTQFSKYMLRQNFIQMRFVFVDDYIAMIWTTPIV